MPEAVNRSDVSGERKRVATLCRRVAPRTAEVDDQERRRGDECHQHQCERARESPPPTPRDDDERRREQQARVVDAGSGAGRNGSEIGTTRHAEPERRCDRKRQRDIGQRRVRVRDMRRRHRDNRSADRTGEEAPVQTACHPPRDGDGCGRRHHDDDPRRQVRRSALPGLERHERVQEQRRVAKPVRIAAAAVDEPPRTRHDVPLVRIEEVVDRKAMAQPDGAQRDGERHERDEGGARAAPVRLRAPAGPRR